MDDYMKNILYSSMMLVSDLYELLYPVRDVEGFDGAFQKVSRAYDLIYEMLPDEQDNM